MPSPLRFAPALLALVVVGPVQAQSTEDLSLSFSQNPFEELEGAYYVSIDDCAGQLSGDFTLIGDYAGDIGDASLRLTLTDGADVCDWDDFSGTCDLTRVEVDGRSCFCLKEGTSAQIQATAALNDLISDTCDQLIQGAEESRWRFFIQHKGTNIEGSEVVTPGESLDVVFDFKPPTQPAEAPSVVGVEGGLVVSIAEVSGGETVSYEVCYKEEGAPGAPAGATGNAAKREGYTCTSAAPNQSKRLSDLQNGVVYSVVYAGFDAAGNRSLNSPASTGTPEESYDFAEWYHSRNGPATGGCSQVPGHGEPSWLVGLAIAGLFLRRRRWALAALATCLPLAGHAEETPRTASVELRVGAYLPDIDKTFPSASCKASGQCPYEAVFQNEDPLMLMLLVDKHLIVDYGTLSLGGGFGYWNVEGKALLGAGTRAADTTELSVFPMMIQATYHFDIFQEYVPIVPVVRGGLDYYFWRILDGEGEVASFEPGDKATGGTLGWHFAVGAHILLDFFAPDMASDFDRDVGVNNSYFTVEYQQSDITGFGSSESLRLGSEVLFFGIALDF